MWVLRNFIGPLETPRASAPQARGSFVFLWPHHHPTTAAKNVLLCEPVHRRTHRSGDRRPGQRRRLALSPFVDPRYPNHCPAEPAAFGFSLSTTRRRPSAAPPIFSLPQRSLLSDRGVPHIPSLHDGRSNSPGE